MNILEYLKFINAAIKRVAGKTYPKRICPHGIDLNDPYTSCRNENCFIDKWNPLIKSQAKISPLWIWGELEEKAIEDWEQEYRETVAKAKKKFDRLGRGLKGFKSYIKASFKNLRKDKIKEATRQKRMQPTRFLYSEDDHMADYVKRLTLDDYKIDVRAARPSDIKATNDKWTPLEIEDFINSAPLSEEEKDFIYYHMQGYTLDMLTEHFGITAQAIQKRIQRNKEFLKYLYATGVGIS